MKTLKELFILEIKDLRVYSEYVSELVPKVEAVVTDSDIQDLLEDYQRSAVYQLEILDSYMDSHSIVDKIKNCHALKAIKGFIEVLISRERPREIQDLAVLAGLQKIEHYQACVFGTALAHAKEYNLKHEIDMLTTFKQKANEKGNSPLQLAHQILEKKECRYIKDDVFELLGSLITAQYHNESKLDEFLDTLQAFVSSPLLSEALEAYIEHRMLVRDQLDSLLSRFELSVNHSEWEEMEGFLEETQEMMALIGKGALRDAALLGCLQRIQHVKIAECEFNKLLSSFIEDSDLVQIFEDLKSEEMGFDENFTAVAEGTGIIEGVNPQAKESE